MTDIVTIAYNDFMTRAFGEVPKHPHEYTIKRSTYTQLMRDVQATYDIYQGHPAFLELMLTMVGRSPRIIDDEGDAHE